MSFEFDFGFEGLGTRWDDSKLALLFAADGKYDDLGESAGPLAVADASRYAEFFEMNDELSPMKAGVYAEICGGPDPIESAVSRAFAAQKKGILPVVIGDNRRIAEKMDQNPLVALWGRIGRKEADEPSIFQSRRALLAGVRAAASDTFEVISKNTKIVTARALKTKPAIFESAVNQFPGPAHLSIDLDVLSPSSSQTPRSIEPGGISWYELVDAIDIVFAGPGVASADVTGTKDIRPKSPTALLCAQILVKIAGAATRFRK